MPSPPFAIYTASDKKYGDFLIDHWFKSLRERVDLSRIDVRILDFGLSTAQRYYLEHHGAAVRRCVKDGHVAVVRFRELAEDLRQSSYEQVLAVDGGDIIFQDDISSLFTLHPERFRAVPEDLNSGFDIFLREEYFARESIGAIRRATALRPQINAGFVLGPRTAFLRLCDEIGRLVLDPKAFGPDQLVVNKVLHESGYFPLPRHYNFVVATAQQEFLIEEGTFLSAGDRRPIAVVHNAGNWKFLRPIENFGYGPDCNRLKPDVLTTLRFIHQSNHLLKNTQGKIRRFARSAIGRTAT